MSGGLAITLPSGFAPPDLDGVVAWWDLRTEEHVWADGDLTVPITDGAAIAAVSDRSGNGHHLLQPTAELQPEWDEDGLEGEGLALFDATHRLEIPAAVNPGIRAVIACSGIRRTSGAGAILATRGAATYSGWWLQVSAIHPLGLSFGDGLGTASANRRTGLMETPANGEPFSFAARGRSDLPASGKWWFRREGESIFTGPEPFAAGTSFSNAVGGAGSVGATDRNSLAALAHVQQIIVATDISDADVDLLSLFVALDGE
jgi:hypothetical protein